MEGSGEGLDRGRGRAPAGAPGGPPPHRREHREEREFASTQKALEAAIAAIETNESYPEAIHVDGGCVMDRASILRAWEDRHDPG